MDESGVEMLEALVDKYGLEDMLSGLSFICGRKAERLAEDWQDINLAKIWMGYSTRIDTLSAEFLKLKNKISM
jgi:hypothetical protein